MGVSPWVRGSGRRAEELHVLIDEAIARGLLVLEIRIDRAEATLASVHVQPKTSRIERDRCLPVVPLEEHLSNIEMAVARDLDAVAAERIVIRADDVAAVDAASHAEGN